jgi:tetratricopeptide (TPR) repeat protein
MEWQKNFLFQGRSLPYNRIANNNRAERAIEIPIAFDFLSNLKQGMKVLEIGNVLVNYEDLASEYKSFGSRRTIDKYEIGDGIENIDLMDMPAIHPEDLYDAIICVSTVEHVGQGGYGSQIQNRNLEAPLLAIAKIYQILKIGGKAMITTHCGKPIDGGWYVQSSPAYLDLLCKKYQIPIDAIKFTYLKRMGMEEIEFENPLQTWVQVEREEMEAVYYDFPWNYGNGLVAIELTKTTNDFHLHLDLPPSDLFYYHPIDAVLNQTHIINHAVGIELEAIIAACQAILKAMPKYATAYWILGRANYLQGNLDTAKANLLKAIEFQSDLAIAHWQLGDIYYQEGRADRAFSHKQTALALKPDLMNAEMHNRVGIALVNEGKPQDAIQSFQRAITLQPYYPLAFYNLGNAHVEMQNLDAAIAAYRQAIAICVDIMEDLNETEALPETDIPTLLLSARLNLGATLTQQEQLAEASDCYQKIIGDRPEFPEAYYYLGLIWARQGEIEDAITCFLTAIEMQPDCVDAYVALGNLRFQQNHLSDAIDCYRKALEIQPDCAEAHDNLENALKQESIGVSASIC